MLSKLLYGFLSLTPLASTAIIPRGDPPFQDIPATAKPDNTFNVGTFQLVREPDGSAEIPPAVYGARSVDLPFGRLYHGNMKFFGKGQLNTPDDIKDVYNPGVNDFANQSACGIPDNAFLASKVAIHPYFLKYADLSRYCMQDVCISFWKEDGSSDMILKVTDICSTDPDDPTHCATPADIKVERTKAQVMEHLTGDPLLSQPQLTGDQYPEKIWWFFTKCWADALAQPAYQGSANNWFTTPPLPNNLAWAMKTGSQQYDNNQVAYAAKGWPIYPQGAYNTRRDDTTSPPITDWVAGQEPAWSPIAGGKGWGNPSGGGIPVNPQPVIPAQKLYKQPVADTSSQLIYLASFTSPSSSEAPASSYPPTTPLTTPIISSKPIFSKPPIFLNSTTSIPVKPIHTDQANTSPTSSSLSEVPTSSHLPIASLTALITSDSKTSMPFKPIQANKQAAHVEPVTSTPTESSEDGDDSDSCAA